nr:hypothetical protein [Tanacetum cinerariifolium]
MMVMIVNNSFRLFMNRNRVTIKTMMYPEIHPPSQETSDEVFQVNHSIQNEESFENPSNEIVVSNSNEEKEEPAQESDILTKSNAENLLPIPSECEVALEDKRECDVPISENSPVYDNHSDTFFDSKIDDDISIYDDDFEDIEYVEASLPDPGIVSVEEENVVQQEEEEVDFEDISQIQDIVLREKLLSITRLIYNIESLNDNPTPDHVLNSFESDNSLLDNFLPEFENFAIIQKGREVNDIPDNSSNNSLLEEVDLFLADHSIPPGIENFYDPEGDIRFLEELLIDDSILSHELPNSNFKDNLSIPRPPPEPPDAETNTGEEIPVVMNDKDEDVYSSFIFVIFAKMFSLLPQRVRT